MNDERAFFQTVEERPDDTALRLVFADRLEERGDPRGELIRLLHTLTQAIEVPDRRKLEERLRNLLASGVQPVGPFWANSIGMKFAWVPAGTFLMGSEDGGCDTDVGGEETAHPVILTKGFYLGVYPVTQVHWKEIMGKNPSHFRSRSRKDPTKTDYLPVEMVSWNKCKEFLRKLSEREGHDYRFPTRGGMGICVPRGHDDGFLFRQ